MLLTLRLSFNYVFVNKGTRIIEIKLESNSLTHMGNKHELININVDNMRKIFITFISKKKLEFSVSIALL